MTKQELASYLASILAIDSYLDDIGIPTPAWFNREQAEMLKSLEDQVIKEQKEKDNASRQSNAGRVGVEEERAHSQGS